MMRAATASAALAACVHPAHAERITCILTDVGGGPIENLEIVMPDAASRAVKGWERGVTFKGDEDGSFTKIRDPKVRMDWPKRLDIVWTQDVGVDKPRIERNAIRVHHIDLAGEEVGSASIKAGHPAMVLTNRTLLGRDGQVHGPGWYIEGQCQIRPDRAADNKATGA